VAATNPSVRAFNPSNLAGGLREGRLQAAEQAWVRALEACRPERRPEMTELSAKARAKLPKKDFAEPEKRAYPIEDKAHARNAKARASQAVKAGRMSKAEEKRIDSKADAVLKKS
jgi:hypothetical protein